MTEAHPEAYVVRSIAIADSKQEQGVLQQDDEDHIYVEAYM